jgi:COP9 signalosome complex subunit 6
LQEYGDVQLTAFLASLTKSTNILNDVGLDWFLTQNEHDIIDLQLVDKHLVLTTGKDERGGGGGHRRRMGRQGAPGDWDRFH